MQIKKSGLGVAVCEGMGTTREVDTLLVGDQPPGTWVLVFLNSAREILTEDNAMKISNAVRAVDSVMNHQDGMSTQSLNRDSIDALFTDLIDREPQKPASLIALEQARLKQGK